MGRFRPSEPERICVVEGDKLPPTAVYFCTNAVLLPESPLPSMRTITKPLATLRE